MGKRFTTFPASFVTRVGGRQASPSGEVEYNTSDLRLSQGSGSVVSCRTRHEGELGARTRGEREMVVLGRAVDSRRLRRRTERGGPGRARGDVDLARAVRGVAQRAHEVDAQRAVGQPRDRGHPVVHAGIRGDRDLGRGVPGASVARAVVADVPAEERFPAEPDQVERALVILDEMRVEISAGMGGHPDGRGPVVPVRGAGDVDVRVAAAVGEPGDDHRAVAGAQDARVLILGGAAGGQEPRLGRREGAAARHGLRGLGLRARHERHQQPHARQQPRQDGRHFAYCSAPRRWSET